MHLFGFIIPSSSPMFNIILPCCEPDILLSEDPHEDLFKRLVPSGFSTPSSTVKITLRTYTIDLQS